MFGDFKGQVVKTKIILTIRTMETTKLYLKGEKSCGNVYKSNLYTLQQSFSKGILKKVP